MLSLQCVVWVLDYFSVAFKFDNHIAEEERADCLTLLVCILAFMCVCLFFVF